MEEFGGGGTDYSRCKDPEAPGMDLMGLKDSVVGDEVRRSRMGGWVEYQGPGRVFLDNGSTGVADQQQRSVI